MFASCTQLSTLNANLEGITTFSKQPFGTSTMMINKVLNFQNVEYIGRTLNTHDDSIAYMFPLFETSTPYHVYLPKLGYFGCTNSGTVPGNTYSSDTPEFTTFGYRSDTGTLNTLYFRDLTKIGAFAFAKGNITTLVFNCAPP
jgi:hypothetical protein